MFNITQSILFVTVPVCYITILVVCCINPGCVLYESQFSLYALIFQTTLFVIF